MCILSLPLYYLGVSQPKMFALSTWCMEVLFLLYYELAKFTERLDDFQITKKSDVIKKNELFSFQLFITNPETILIPATLFEEEKKKTSQLPSDTCKFICWKFLRYKGDFILTSQEEDSNISSEDCQNSGSARAAHLVTASVLFPQGRILDAKVHTLV